MNAGSYYYNYKNFHSIILMALVDGDYKFTWVEVGANSTSSDVQIFKDCGLQAVIDQRVIGFLLLTACLIMIKIRHISMPSLCTPT